jgi:hypothetical protein
MDRNTLLFFLFGVALSGCSSEGVAKYTPTEDRARGALTATLDAWQTSKPEVALAETKINVSDTHRRAGQQLKTYEILGELPADNGRRFQVKLQLDNPAAEEKVQYLVVGIDPIWVFRQEDYDLIAHWDHPMTPPGDGAANQPKSGDAPDDGKK